MPAIRVMTYNIFMGGRHGSPLHEVVRQSAPDVLLVNECPKWPLIWKHRCRLLAETWEMRYAGGGRNAGSNMLAAGRSVAVKRLEAKTFDTPLFKPRRGVVAAQLRIDSRLLGVVGCHLSLDADRRAIEVEQILRIADTLRGPVILGGDLNERPNGPSWQRLRRAGFVDHGSAEWLTYPAGEPEKRIDALLVRGNVTVTQHGDPGVPLDLQAAASDHRPVFAVLEL